MLKELSTGFDIGEEKMCSVSIFFDEDNLLTKKTKVNYTSTDSKQASIINRLNYD